VETVLLHPFLKEWQAVPYNQKIKTLEYVHVLHSAEYSDKMMEALIISGLNDLVDANEAAKDKTRIFTAPSKKVIVLALEDVKAGKLVMCPASSQIGEPKGSSAIARASPLKIDNKASKYSVMENTNKSTGPYWYIRTVNERKLANMRYEERNVSVSTQRAKGKASDTTQLTFMVMVNSKVLKTFDELTIYKKTEVTEPAPSNSSAKRVDLLNVVDDGRPDKKSKLNQI
jgi:hypothetical protein